MAARPRLWHLIALAALLAGCGQRPVQLPAADGARDAANLEDDLVSEMVKACPRLPFTARVRIEGTIHGKRVRRSLWVGTDAVHMRIEASAADGAPFVLWGGRAPQSPRSGLWLPLEGKVTESDDLRPLADAALGVPLTALELQGLLTSCPIFEGGGVDVLPVAPDARQMVFTENATHTNEVALTRQNARSPWRVRSVTITRKGWPRWRIDFSSNLGEVPTSVHISRLEWTGEKSRDLDVRVTVERLRLDMGVGPSVLIPSPPASEVRVSLSDITANRGGRPLLVR